MRGGPEDVHTLPELLLLLLLQTDTGAGIVVDGGVVGDGWAGKFRDQRSRIDGEGRWTAGDAFSGGTK